MRVLFAAFPVAARAFPVPPLAWALQNAGHEVRVATHPDLVRRVTGAGLAAVPVGQGEDLAALTDLSRNPALAGHPGGGLHIGPGDCPDWGAQWYRTTRAFAALRPLLEELTGTVVRWRPDLVLWDPFCLPAAVAARVGGAAHARLLWGRDNIAWLRGRSARYHDQAPGDGFPEPLEETMQQLLEPYGLPYAEELVLGQWTVDPMPPGMRLSAPGVRYENVRWVPYGGGGSIPERLRGRPLGPRVWVAGEEFADALRELDLELVGPLDAPWARLLPSCSAVVHHGGAEVFASAAAAGVPQLIVPEPAWDEEAATVQLVRKGAGVALRRGESNPESLRAALRSVLQDCRDGAGLWREELARLPGPAELVPVLEELTRQHQRI
ncbi:nucleotide disphospho-sugar-binding domain-containing protein [Streptomyces sp. NPDC096205]|uniref:nucleotide disphospho-sugar-binding domain-containing protein n=1 Tax=Streptomyces sp. NPDC096205 TaxID=3366081 RepID=UPI0037F9744D